LFFLVPSNCLPSGIPTLAGKWMQSFKDFWLCNLGLSDCIYNNTQNSNSFLILLALEWKMLVYFMGGSVYFMAVSIYVVVLWCILWPFGIFCGRLLLFSRFGTLQKSRKIWQPWFALPCLCLS
jgi:hypothetical protein